MLSWHHISIVVQSLVPPPLPPPFFFPFFFFVLILLCAVYGRLFPPRYRGVIARKEGKGAPRFGSPVWHLTPSLPGLSLPFVASNATPRQTFGTCRKSGPVLLVSIWLW